MTIYYIIIASYLYVFLSTLLLTAYPFVRGLENGLYNTYAYLFLYCTTALYTKRLIIIIIIVLIFIIIIGIMQMIGHSPCY